MKKLLAFPVIAGLALSGCARGPAPFSPDVNTVDFVQAATVASKTFCGLLPTADTLAKIVLALALPAGVPVEAVASAAAHAFCDTVGPLAASKAGRRAIEPSTGRPVIDYGPQILPNGKVVPIAVYVQ